ncbi:hypothetical protein OXPF_00760 [Oxobacter pfennigii]|uniref:PhoU domain-containing protein n=1 Tax=Oxobacter pfennigii TaxID=36849 RepID=A0A0P8WE06_9CLOT|nr:Na/Pi cotransporter family protein [Oxobacter pfennigii]KPU46348.1 hypothetical protein OXPF_00760 [Oxobacter pfennigii]
MDYKMLFSLIGGLGLFIFGMKLMSDGLQKVAGDKLKKLLEILTNNRIMGILVGTVVTSIIQSSSATTVMVIGFVNAGLMTLTQAAGVIMGANIGTTMTAQLIAFKLTTIAPVIVGIGVAMNLFGKKKRTKQYGEILLGFGILFMGMQTMEVAMKPLVAVKEFQDLILTLGKHPLLGVVVGMGMTAVVQSSSATIGILMAIASTGAIDINVTLPILFGDNIGTCATALLASISANKTAKKAALLHLTFNIIGTVVFMILLVPVKELIGLIAQATGTVGDVQRDIANAHTLFNLTNTIIQTPFIAFLVAFVNKLIPGTDDVEVMSLKYLDERIIETPAIAVGQTVKEVVRMGNVASENIKIAMDSFFNENENMVNVVYEKEDLINFLEREITSYLVKLSQKPLSEEQSEIVTSLFHTVNDIERIGDHAENLAEYAMYRIDSKLKFSDTAIEQLKTMSQKVYQSSVSSIKALDTGDVENAMSVIVAENDIDTMEKNFRKEHIDRLNQGVCTPASGTVFLDIISNLERIADHANNIAQAVTNRV